MCSTEATLHTFTVIIQVFLPTAYSLCLSNYRTYNCAFSLMNMNCLKTLWQCLCTDLIIDL